MIMNKQSYIKLAWTSLVVVFMVIIAGSLVRMTGSGMGCPDWPKCFGYYIPPTNVNQVLWQPNKEYFEGQMIVHDDVLYESQLSFTSSTTFNGTNWANYTKHNYAKFNATHTWIEYINRLVGALSGFFVLALFGLSIVGWRRKWLTIWDVVFAFILLILLGFQAWLGKTVVDSNLAPLKITFHMFGALAIVALLIWMIARAKEKTNRLSPSINAMGWVALILILVQIYLGTGVRQEVDEVVKSFDHNQRELWMNQVSKTNIFKIHRSFAWIILFTSGWVLYQSKKIKIWNTSQKWITGILITEVLIGIILAKFNIPALGQPTHLLLACLLFSFLFWTLLGSRAKA